MIISIQAGDGTNTLRRVRRRAVVVVEVFLATKGCTVNSKLVPVELQVDTKVFVEVTPAAYLETIAGIEVMVGVSYRQGKTGTG